MNSSPASARSSLRVYLAVVILIATVPLTILSFVLITRERDSAQVQLEAGLRSLARSHALLVESELGATIESLTILARSQALVEQRHAELRPHLQEIVRIVPNWHGLYLTDWLQNLSTPKDGFVHIFDGNHRILAHSKNPSLYLAQRLPDDAPERSDTALSGSHQAGILEGGTAFQAWQRTSRGEWGAAAGVPAEPVK